MIYKTINEKAGAEYVVSKSRFIAWAYPVRDAEDAEAILASLRKEHAFATHICYAFITREAAKASDDGEPKGTAGAPILEILKKNGLSNVLVAVVRYFGGIKLGAGGLVRAYGRAAAEALGEAEIVTVERLKIFKAALPFSAAAKLVLNSGVELSREYGENVIVTAAARDGDALGEEIREAAGKNLELEFVGEEWIPFKNRV